MTYLNSVSIPIVVIVAACDRNHLVQIRYCSFLFIGIEKVSYMVYIL